LLEVAILAGGEGKRLGTGIKPLLQVCGKPILLRLLEKLEVLGLKPLIIVHDEEQKKKIEEALVSAAVKAGWRVLLDALNKQASIVGIYTALINASGEVIGVMPSDTPFLNPAALLRLHDKLKDSDASIPLWPNGYIEPLIAIYRVQPTLRAVEGSLVRGSLQVSSALRRLRASYVPVSEVFDSPEVETLNINTPEDLERAEEICANIAR
jgi:molybdopterin-guanine dinucleotide biosynthesis protein A